MKLPLTIALERDNIDLQVVRRLYEAYPQALAERGGGAGGAGGGGSVGGGGHSGSKLPLQILVENYLHSPHSNLCVVDFIARMYPAAILATSTAIKRDSPMLLALDRNIFDVSRRFLMLCPTYNPTMLRNLHWRARKIAFLLAKRQIFRPSILHRLAQLAAGTSGKGAVSTVTCGGGNVSNVSPSSSLKIFQSAFSSMTAAAIAAGEAGGGGGGGSAERGSARYSNSNREFQSQSQSHSHSQQHSDFLREVNAALKPRRRKNSNSAGVGGGGGGAFGGEKSGGASSFSPVPSPSFGEFLPSMSSVYDHHHQELNLPHLSPTGFDTGTGTSIGAGLSLNTWSGEDVHDIYGSPSSRPSLANSPRAADAHSPRGGGAPVNFYLRLYKANSDAFRLAVTYL